MGTTFLAPSGGKADLPLPGVTQSLALWARIFTKIIERENSLLSIFHGNAGAFVNL
jgi:hypothetical protein